MGGNLFKTIIAILMLALLAFLAGSLAADGAKQALMPVGLIIGLFVLLYLGKNCWWLVYAASVLTPLLGISLFANFPVAYALSAVLLVYWLVMYVVGQVKITWHALWPLDIITGIFLLYFMITWIRHPVYLNAMVDDLIADGDAQFGGKPYVWAVAAALVYIFISIVPVKLEELIKVLKVLTWFIIPLALLGAAKVILMGGSVTPAGEDMGTAISNSRFGAFVGVSRSVYILLVCKYSVLGFAMSPIKLAMLLFATLGIALSGFREQMMNAAVITFVSQWLHKQLSIFVVLCVIAYAGVVYLSSEELLEDFPYGVKRVLSAVPGVKFKDNRAAGDAEGSIEWRVEMWKWALTPSMGYIKDYVWGDGFGVSSTGLRNQSSRKFRGYVTDSNKDFARAGIWHNGAITAIHRTGYVGLAMVTCWFLIMLFYTFRLCWGVRCIVGREYICFFTIPLVSTVFLFYISAGEFELIFSYFINVLVMKVTYVLARERGLIQPLFARKVYVPLMHREADEAGAATQKAALPLHS